MAPRKKKEAAPVAAKKGKPVAVFGAVQTGVPIPPKNTRGEFYKHIAALDVDAMLPVSGVTIGNARTNMKRVTKDTGRTFDVRLADEDNADAGVHIWRLT